MNSYRWHIGGKTALEYKLARAAKSLHPNAGYLLFLSYGIVLLIPDRSV